jgi:flavin reductase (DIM6/NTAB) family NADH-FMN oxidoreductase RutF
MIDSLITLDTGKPIWDQFFTVSSLVIVGSKEHGGFDLAPKHMAMPIGWDNYFGFVCTPAHSTYQNIKREGMFTISFPRPRQVVITSITASPRCGPKGDKPLLNELDTFPSTHIDGVFVRDAYLFLECTLDRIIDGFGSNALIVGRIVAAHVHKDAYRQSDSEDAQQIHESPLLAYLSPGRFASVRETFAFPFPNRFRK